MAHISSMNKEEFAKYDDELNRILKEFHYAVFGIITIAESIDPKNYYISWVKQQIDIFRKIDKENIIKRLKNRFWDFRKEIMAHDLAFFKNNQYSNYIKNDENKQFMYSFVNMLKKKIDELSPEEIEKVWELIEKVLISCIEYKKLIKDWDY